LKTLKIEGIKNMGKLFISWKKNDAFHLIQSQKSSSFESKANQFHILKESFHQNGKFNSEDSAYVAFKRYEMAAERKLGKESGGLSYISSEIFHFFKWVIFDRAGLFATSPIRVFVSMLFVLSFFAVVYIILPYFADANIISSIGESNQLGSIGKGFYHSAITFFTIGYGDFYPSGHIRWLSAIEGWAGVFLMSYFTVAFVRKILR
ncbi:potassium channel family protein, partial [Vicingaceae bacterium]|nr:potassium channel family protein [Vicingaceae bacterium]